MNNTVNLPTTICSAESVSQALVLLKALEAICDLDPGSTLQPDINAVCDAVNVARSLILRAKENTDQTGAWNTSAAPKDRPIMVVGKIMAHDEFSVAAIPFSGAVEWKVIENHADWYWYFGSGYPQCVRSALDDELIIHYWQEMPAERKADELERPVMTAAEHNAFPKGRW
jgi:hypothetical protein